MPTAPPDRTCCQNASPGRTARAVGLTTLALLLGGCASAARDVGKAAAPAAVQAGLQQANAPDTQQQIQKLIDAKAFQNAGQSVGVGVGIGLFNEANRLSGLTPSGTQPATRPETGSTEAPITDAGASATGPAGGQATGAAATEPATKPAPSGPPAAASPAGSPGAAAVAGLAGGSGGLNGLVQSSIQQAFLAATDPRFKEGERALSEAVGEGFLQGIMTVLDKEGPRLGRTIQTQLGPIIRMVIREQIAPAVKDTLENQIAPAALRVWKQGAVETLKLTVRPDLQPDVMKNAENASIGAGRGTTQGLIDAGLLSRDGGLTATVRLYFWAAAIAAALIGLALFCLLVLLNLLVLRRLWSPRRGEAGDRVTR